MTTASEVRARVLAAAQSADVAVAFGVSPSAWASVLAPHTFDGDRMATGGRNRGRLPFVEVFIATQPFVPEGDGIGMVESRVTVKAHAGGADATTAHELCEAGIAALFAAIRADQYFNIGECGVDGYSTNPLWHRVDAHLTVQHTYDPATFEGG